MIHPDLLNRFQLLAEAYRLPAAPADGPREVSAVTGVQQVLARVEERLPDGRYRVLAAGRRFDVDLPTPARPGDRVQVALPATTDGTSSARQLQTPPSVLGDVSGAGRLVAQLAAKVLDARTPGTISAAQPLLPDAPVDTKIAAATLREQVGLSGLFYESHQAEWVSGERDAQQLRREPQGRLDPALAEAQVLARAAAMPADPLSADASFGRPLQLHPEAAPLVQQQINALEARHIVWIGEAWPGQPMRWEIEDAEEREPDSAESTHVWRTRVDLHLPRLGTVTALFTLGAGGVGVRLLAESQSTDGLLAQRLPELHGALVSAGLEVAEIARDPRARTG